MAAEPGSAPRPPLFHCGLGLFTGYKMMQFFFFPERTHPPPPGGTRRPRFSGRHADQTRCHGGRPHPGKAPLPALRAPIALPSACLPHASELTPPRSLETPRMQRHILLCPFLGVAVEFKDTNPHCLTFQVGILKFANL